MTGALLRHFVFPAWHWVRNDGVNAAVRELERNQWLPTSELLDLQQRKLARLLAFAGRNVPYYRSLLDTLGISYAKPITIDDFQRIPPLTKDIIRHEATALVSENLKGNALRSNSTSGSTGEATRFFTDARSTPYRQASLLRSDSWTGWQLGEPVVRVWGAPIDVKLATGLRGRLHGLVTRDRLLSSFELSPDDMDRYIKSIRDFKPVLIVAYPGPLEQLAVHCSRSGATLPTVRAIVSSAETLWPHQRESIEDAFGVRVFDRYGSREVAHIASECEAHDGLHISVDRLLVEVVDDENQPCDTNQVGRILVTDLDNFGMPLIRYDIGDQGAMGELRTCSCGRGLPMLEKVEGRTMEIVHTPDGRRIGGTFWTILLKSRPGLRQIQVVQERLNGVVINFVRETNFNEAVLDYFAAKIKEYCGRNFEVEFVEKEFIDLTSSGKRRLIVSHLARESGGTGNVRR